MTLLEAVESLAIVELATVSWINICPLDGQSAARFTMALLVPFNDPALPEQLRSGRIRFWPDQERLLEGPPPIHDQINELHVSGILGNLATVHLRPRDSRALWMIETHAGSREERLDWLRSVITMERRSPVTETGGTQR
jgi:hypothetical protein